MMISLKGNPLSTNNIYKRHKFNIYLSPEGKAMKESYQWQANSQWKKGVLSGGIDLKVKLFFGDKRRRDIDNYNKLLLDSLTGIIWEDDKQIQIITIIKSYDKEDPRIDLEIEEFVGSQNS